MKENPELEARINELKLGVETVVGVLLKLDPGIKNIILGGSFGAYWQGKERSFVKQFSLNSDGDLSVEPGEVINTQEELEQYRVRFNELNLPGPIHVYVDDSIDRGEDLNWINRLFRKNLMAGITIYTQEKGLKLPWKD